MRPQSKPYKHRHGILMWYNTVVQFRVGIFSIIQYIENYIILSYIFLTIYINI